MIDNSKIEEIEIYIKNNVIPKEIKYEKHSHIFNTQKFLNSHLKLIKSNLGSYKFKKPYYDRVLNVFEHIKLQKKRNL